MTASRTSSKPHSRTSSTPHPYKVGDRVTREVYMDDGTWARKGDSCLPKSPLKHGEVVGKWIEGGIRHYLVRWDWTEPTTSRRTGVYFQHGITLEIKGLFSTPK